MIRLKAFLFNDSYLFSFILKILFLVGIWPDEESVGVRRMLYRGYEMLLHMMTLMLEVIASIAIYILRDDTLMVAECLDKMLVAYNATVKVVLFTMNRKHLQRLVRDMTASGDTITKENDRSMTRLVLFIFGTGTSVMTAFTLFAIYDGELVIQTWFPFDAVRDKKRAFYANQFIALMFIPNVWRMLGMQGLFCCLVMFLCEQLKELQGRLRVLSYSVDRDEEVRKELGDIITKHCRIIGYVKTMSKGFTDVLFVQNLAVTVEMCLNAFMVSMVGTNDKPRLVNFATFLLVTLFNAYIYCHVGNELIIQSEELAQAAYSSPWTSWPLDLQKDLLTVVRSAQRPLYLSAGIYVMSLQTYAKIVYNGYSIFAMLYDAAN